jgi:predicted O-methyltransferase YrrM
MYSNILRGKGTLEIGYPWLTPGSIVALERLLTPEMKILEFGSGGSTIFFSRRCKSVKTFEMNETWYHKVKANLSDLTNATIVLGTALDIRQAIIKEPTEYYDVILADSGPSYKDRLHFANDSVPKLKIGGYLVIDNYDQKIMRMFDYQNWDVYTFDVLSSRYQGRGTRICIKK